MILIPSTPTDRHGVRRCLTDLCRLFNGPLNVLPSKSIPWVWLPSGILVGAFGNVGASSRDTFGQIVSGAGFSFYGHPGFLMAQSCSAGVISPTTHYLKYRYQPTYTWDIPRVLHPQGTWTGMYFSLRLILGTFYSAGDVPTYPDHTTLASLTPFTFVYDSNHWHEGYALTGPDEVHVNGWWYGPENEGSPGTAGSLIDGPYIGNPSWFWPYGDDPWSWLSAQPAPVYNAARVGSAVHIYDCAVNKWTGTRTNTDSGADIAEEKAAIEYGTYGFRDIELGILGELLTPITPTNTHALLEYNYNGPFEVIAPYTGVGENGRWYPQIGAGGFPEGPEHLNIKLELFLLEPYVRTEYIALFNSLDTAITESDMQQALSDIYTQHTDLVAPFTASDSDHYQAEWTAIYNSVGAVEITKADYWWAFNDPDHKELAATNDMGLNPNDVYYFYNNSMAWNLVYKDDIIDAGYPFFGVETRWITNVSQIWDSVWRGYGLFGAYHSTPFYLRKMMIGNPGEIYKYDVERVICSNTWTVHDPETYTPENSPVYLNAPESTGVAYLDEPEAVYDLRPFHPAPYNFL